MRTLDRAVYGSTRIALTLAACITALLTQACGATPDEQVEQQPQPIQEIQTQKGWYGWTEVMYEQAYPGTATGYVSIPLGLRPDRIPVRGTCGVTFVSPKYAITAAHCVSKAYGVTLDTALTVKYHWLDGTTPEQIAEQAEVSGTFPNYERSKLFVGDGYLTKPFTCKVVRRCDTNDRWGRDNCPFSQTADVALLRCPDRDHHQPWVWGATSESIGEQVEMYWFHEVLDMPRRDPRDPGSTQQERWDHYGRLTDDKADNYHYLGGGRNQLLPLVSRRWFEWHTVSLDSDQNDDVHTYTNLGGCHGSSGSGVFRRSDNRWELLGPVARGLWAGLCSISKEVDGPGDVDDPIIGYVRPRFTRQVANAPEVNTDRQSGPG